jgi:hypothetical protein
MKAILKFNLPEDNTEYLATVKAMDMTNFIFELVYNTKKGLINQAVNENEIDGIERVFEKIYDLLDHHNIIIDELI